METGTIIAIVAILFELIGLVVVAVWVVGKIRTTTETLSILIQGLTDNINRLHNWLNEVDDKTRETSERLKAVETELEVKSKYFPQKLQAPPDQSGS